MLFHPRAYAAGDKQARSSGQSLRNILLHYAPPEVTVGLAGG